jgi:hypothetical protein
MGLSPRRTIARVGRALGRPLGPAFALLVAITACRGVIGYRPLTLGDANDAGPSAEGGPASDARADVRADSTADAAPSPGDAACPGATPATLFTTPFQLQGLFLGGDRVYAEITNPFLVEADGAVLPDPSMGLVACPKSGCSVTPDVLADYTSIVDGAAWGSAAATDGGLVYALPSASYDQSQPDGSAGFVEQAALDGGGVQLVASGLAFPLYLTSAGAIAYWVDDPFDLVFTDAAVTWSVRAAPLGRGSGPSSVFAAGFATGGVVGFFSDTKNVYVLAADAVGALGLFACPLLAADAGGCGGQATELISGLAYPVGPVVNDSFAADGVNVYQAGMNSGAITSYSLETHAPVTLASGQPAPTHLTVAGAQLYWSTGRGVIFHMPKNGSQPPSPLVCGLSDVVAIASDTARVYFIASDPANPGRAEVASVPAP